MLATSSRKETREFSPEADVTSARQQLTESPLSFPAMVQAVVGKLLLNRRCSGEANTGVARDLAGDHR